MIKLICDRCGEDCGLNGYDVLVNVLHNPVPTSMNDVGDPQITDDTTSLRMLLCQHCYKELGLPNVYTASMKGTVTFRE